MHSLIAVSCTCDYALDKLLILHALNSAVDMQMCLC